MRLALDVAGLLALLWAVLYEATAPQAGPALCFADLVLLGVAVGLIASGLRVKVVELGPRRREQIARVAEQQAGQR